MAKKGSSRDSLFSEARAANNAALLAAFLQRLESDAGASLLQMIQTYEEPGSEEPMKVALVSHLKRHGADAFDALVTSFEKSPDIFNAWKVYLLCAWAQDADVEAPNAFTALGQLGGDLSNVIGMMKIATEMLSSAGEKSSRDLSTDAVKSLAACYFELALHEDDGADKLAELLMFLWDNAPLAGVELPDLDGGEGDVMFEIRCVVEAVLSVRLIPEGTDPKDVGSLTHDDWVQLGSDLFAALA